MLFAKAGIATASQDDYWLLKLELELPLATSNVSIAAQAARNWRLCSPIPCPKRRDCTKPHPKALPVI